MVNTTENYFIDTIFQAETKVGIDGTYQYLPYDIATTHRSKLRLYRCLTLSLRAALIGGIHVMTCGYERFLQSASTRWPVGTSVAYSRHSRDGLWSARFVVNEWLLAVCRCSHCISVLLHNRIASDGPCNSYCRPPNL